MTPNSFESDEYQPLALLSQAVVIPPTSDPFSFFERAILKFRCLILPVTFAGIPHQDEQPWYFRHEYSVDLSSVGLDCFRLQACKPFEDTTIASRFFFSKPVDMSLQYFLLPLCLRQFSKSYPRRMYGLLLQRGLREGTEEYTRVGSWSEDNRYSSQLSPMISNTILKLGIGKDSTLSDRSLTENERVFDLKFDEYAAGHVDSKVLFPMKVVKSIVEHESNIKVLDEKAGVPASGDTEQEAIEMKEEEGPLVRDEEVACALLPHFTTAEWGTISLV
ncbi:hypothetical protein BFJ72_g3660 [Fusarium proliferatum]|uniref:Uncharacterized protein n=1 Tax=Gibberella intermedia TaxID=948311 RepID=A0A420TU07_GIBIN|nr:hypothetical protein BFJ72_g3660 [Fusarium proliferatum]